MYAVYDIMLYVIKLFLLLSKIMVTWIFVHYHIVLKMHSMWFSHKNINHKFFVNLKYYFIVGYEIGLFISEDYNMSIKMICLDHGSEDF